MTFDLRFTFDLRLTLRTREEIQVTAYIIVEGGRPYSTALLTPFVDPSGAEENVRAELYASAHAIASRWALRFSRADDIFKDDSYDSLTREILAIASNLFRIRSVKLRDLIPFSPPVPAPPPEPESQIEATLRELQQDTSDYDELRRLVVAMEARYPELFSDSKFGSRMKVKLEAKAMEVLLTRRTK